MSDWQPIETAPKDESWFLGYWADSPMCWGPYELVAWNATLGFFCEQDVSERSPCTHWRPLPPPPPLGTSGGVSDTYELPELPEVCYTAILDSGEGWFVYPEPQTERGEFNLFTADQMREYALLAVQRERARCAQIAENYAPGVDEGRGVEIASLIRSGGR
jgi:hypothetical protein